MNIIYEDNHIIVVQKEPNIPSQQDKTGDIDMLTLVKKYIKEKYNKPGNVYIRSFTFFVSDKHPVTLEPLNIFFVNFFLVFCCVLFRFVI